MKRVASDWTFRPAPFVVLRAPLLPVHAFRDWCEPFVGDPCAPERLAALRARLTTWLEQPGPREALHVASPSLAERARRWHAAPATKDGGKIEAALVRYFARMTTRATPYGLFATVSLGNTGGATHLALDEVVRRRVRLDMGALGREVARLEADPLVREKLGFVAAPVRYDVGDRTRAAVEEAKERGRMFQLVAFERDAPFEAAMGAARGTTLAAIAEHVRALDPSATTEEARAYVDELRASGALVSELTPPVTCADPVREIVATLRSAGLPTEADRLAAIGAACTTLETEPLGLGADDYSSRFHALSSDPITTSQLQVDAFRAGDALTIGDDVLREVHRALAVLRTIMPKRSDPLARLRDRFRERFGDREVPLALALDEDVGTSFGDVEDDDQRPDDDSFGARDAWMLARLERAWARGDRELVIDPTDLPPAAGPPLPLPSSMAAMFTVLASSSEAIAQGDFRVVFGAAVGPSGARTLGRFCAWDRALAERVGEHLREEEALKPDAIFAEVVHRPELSRVANVIVRPPLRAHEIVLCAKSGVDPEHRLEVADLTVALVGERFVLRSRRLGREVVVRLTSAHNYTSGQIALYRFLCALQDHGLQTSLAWRWGKMQNARFLPRVRCGRTILQRATWRLDPREIVALGRPSTSERFAAVQSLRGERALPRFVGFREGDNVLAVDLDNPLTIDAFVAVMKGKSAAELVELTIDAEDLAARAGDAPIAHELLLPFFTVAEPDRRAARASAASTTTTRSFEPGSEWLFGKIYASPTTCDRLLRTTIPALVRSLRAAGSIDGWFFIRYADPEPHVRLRLCGEPKRLATEALPVLRAALAPHLVSELVHLFELSTYEREIDRYGGAQGIAFAERIFAADSDAACALLTHLPVDDRSRRAWVTLAMDRMLADFGFDLARRLAIISPMRAAFSREQQIDRSAELAFDVAHRAERSRLEALVAGRSTEPAFAAVRAILDARSQAMREPVESLKRHGAKGELTRAPRELLEAFLHMTANRVFTDNARVHELAVYTSLEKLYGSELAKRRRRSAT